MSSVTTNKMPPMNAEEVKLMSKEIERLCLLVENSSDVMAEVAGDGQFLYLSPNVRSVLGYKLGELVGSSIFTDVHPEDLRQVQEQFALPGGCFTYRYRHKDGSWRWIETTRKNFPGTAHQMHGALIICDITEQKNAEAERHKLELHLRQVHKLELLGTLAGGIAHDFNNLLAVIISYTELAIMDVDHPLKNGGHLLQVKAASDRARQLVQQILSFSRQEKQERKPMRLHTVIQESLNLMRHTILAPIEIDAQIDADASFVLADATQILQVVMNLCTNAAHAMRQHPGRLSVSLKDFTATPEFIKDIPELRLGTYVQFTVTDTGHGMNSETLKDIFQPFFTTKDSNEGTGLGLPVVQGIVREYGGAIIIHSRLGAGTTVEVYFPASGSNLPESCATSKLRPGADDSWGNVLGDGEKKIRASPTFARRSFQR